MGAAAAFQALVDKQKKGLRDRLPEAAQVLKEECVRLLSHQGSPGHHSRPGEPPYRQSGALQAGVYTRVEGDVIVAGSAASHAKYLKDRPYLHLAWENTKARIMGIIKGK